METRKIGIEIHLWLSLVGNGEFFLNFDLSPRNVTEGTKSKLKFVSPIKYYDKYSTLNVLHIHFYIYTTCTLNFL